MGYENLKFEYDSLFLITGGAGFIGSNLCEALLKKKYKVRCLDNLSTGKIDNIVDFMNDENFEFINGDIRDYQTCFNSCKDVDYVLHQAAWGSVPKSIEMPLIYEEINIKGTLNMLEAARQQKIKKFVFASSSSVYGDEDSLPKVEGKEGNLLSPYALTKKTNEYYAALYSKLYDLNTCGLRYFNVFGKKQNPNGSYAAVIPKFISKLLNNERPTINGDGLQSRDFTYIENVIEANLKACLSDDKYSGESYNIAYGGRETILDVLKYLSNAMGVNIEPIFGPFRNGDIKHSNADITKAMKHFGYNPDWSFETGIKEVVNWYLNHQREKVYE